MIDWTPRERIHQGARWRQTLLPCKQSSCGCARCYASRGRRPRSVYSVYSVAPISQPDLKTRPPSVDRWPLAALLHLLELRFVLIDVVFRDEVDARVDDLRGGHFAVLDVVEDLRRLAAPAEILLPEED